MHRRLITLAVLAMTQLVACAPAEAPEGALPVGMRTAPVPPVRANAYVYVRPPGQVAFSSEALGLDDLTLDSVDVLLAEGSDGVAVRLISPTPVDAGVGVEALDSWVDTGPTGLRLGPETPWGNKVREAWAGQPTRTFARHFESAWEDLQAMPEAPPATPIAAGFVRNFGSLLERLIGEAGVSVPNLADGLSLVRINQIAFVAYADDLERMPERVTPGVLRELDISLLAVADSSYPSAVVGQVFDGFVSSMGLTPVTISDRTGHERQLTGDIFVVVMREGATLFFAVAPTREQAAALVESVVVGLDAA
jgi:hypothetical protein